MKVAVVILLLFIPILSFATKKDSLDYKTHSESSFLKKQILPLSLMASGALLNIGNIKYKMQDKIPKATTDIDDYFQYAPIAEMYLADALGFKHKNTVFDQTKYLLISQLVSGLIVYGIKNTAKVERPWQGTNSFPSGHTSKAFVSAAVLFHEFKDSEPLIAYSGFIFATTTAYLRVAKDGHWVPDVVFSAGLAILTVNLVYYIEPLKNFQPFKKKKNLAFTPLIGTNSLGLSVRF